ncbi:hypothetical protein [Streptomyces litchfieldiae]|uniref:Uncharacterized protein n=1 Tax=Streptomyces litchfieldiae TaxID=3075543 RepID=A0ABU2MY32_9ACTN|nr:hypothetical protein [Streptomyces sp. DSM 44938]MDT0346435.1 hypothetical protein [Streptomyces sp. DSM 44938]
MPTLIATAPAAMPTGRPVANPAILTAMHEKPIAIATEWRVPPTQRATSG